MPEFAGLEREHGGVASERHEGVEPRARLPDLTAAESATVRWGNGSTDQLIVELGSGQQQVIHFLGDSWLTEAGVSAEQISALAGKFRIRLIPLIPPCYEVLGHGCDGAVG
jgi:hypothetical protein